MALDSTSTIDDALAEYNNNLDYDGNLTKAKACLRAVRWLLVNRPTSVERSDHKLDYASLENERNYLTDYIAQNDPSLRSRRASFVGGKMRR